MGGGGGEGKRGRIGIYLSMTGLCCVLILGEKERKKLRMIPGLFA